jgi:predicted Zn-dependent protease
MLKEEQVSKDESTFDAQAFNSRSEVASGKLTFDRLRLRFSSEQINIEIPLTRLDIQKDSESEDRICFSTPDQPDWLICASDIRVLQHPCLRQQPYTRNQIRVLETSVDLKRRLTLTLSVVIGFALLALIVSSVTGIVIRTLLAKVPPEWEQQVGDELMAELKEKETFVRDPGLLAKLDRAVAPFIKSLPPSAAQYKFYILQEPIPNAFALPGGHVLVTTRLLELSDRPEDIAGVVAHEIAHVTQKHGFRKIIASAGPYLIFKVFLGNSAGVLPILGDSSELLVRQSFSQEYELEADELGWESLVAAHIDPRGLANMLRKLQAEHQSITGSGGPKLTAFSSHPATRKRIQRLEEKWKKLNNKNAFNPL